MAGRPARLEILTAVTKSPHEEAEALKVRLDDLHRAKIRLAADEVLAVGDYIGDSTRAELAYARSRGRGIRCSRLRAIRPSSRHGTGIAALQDNVAPTALKQGRLRLWIA